MSVLVHHFVAHQLHLSQGADPQLQLTPKSACYPATLQLQEFALQLHQVFSSKPGKGVGAFAPADSDNGAAFQSLLDTHWQNEADFLAFSIASSELLKKALLEQATPETGFVIFGHYEYLATDYLLIAILNTREHVAINRELEMAHSYHLDLAKMQLAVRIDLSQYQSSPEQQRYISFIKGRMGRKVSDFFMQFIGCEELLDVKQQNKQLVQAVDNYLAAEPLDVAEKVASRQALSDYCKGQLDEGEDIAIQEVAACLPKSDTFSDFSQFNQQAEAPLAEQFQADPATLKSLAKFSGAGGGISLSFERKLYGERIQYDPTTDKLVIQGIPPNLKDQLMRYQGKS